MVVEVVNKCLYIYIMTKDIEGYGGLYTISDTGIVGANERVVKMPNGGEKVVKKHFPKLCKTKKGYLKVMLTGKSRKGFFVHRLVLKHFLYDSEMQVNHKDYNKENNHISNLEYVSNRDNTNHRFLAVKKSSKYAGVTWNKNRGAWQSQKMINGKPTYLGLFDNELDAHNRYLAS